jgi:hypothetical protein
MVLANVDAALFDDLHRMAAGVVVRDHQGHCLLAASEPLPGFTSPELAEALALRRAISLAHNHGFNNAIFALNCLSLIQRVISKVEDRSSVGNVVADIRFEAAILQSASFVHVHRSNNGVAHVFVKSCNVSRA